MHDVHKKYMRILHKFVVIISNNTKKNSFDMTGLDPTSATLPTPLSPTELQNESTSLANFPVLVTDLSNGFCGCV